MIAPQPQRNLNSRSRHIPVQRVNTLVRGKRGVSAETAILLARYLETSPEFWMNLQAGYDLYEAERELSDTGQSAGRYSSKR